MKIEIALGIGQYERDQKIAHIDVPVDACKHCIQKLCLDYVNEQMVSWNWKEVTDISEPDPDLERKQLRARIDEMDRTIEMLREQNRSLIKRYFPLVQAAQMICYSFFSGDLAKPFVSISSDKIKQLELAIEYKGE